MAREEGGEERQGKGRIEAGVEDSVLMSFSHDFRKLRNPPRFKDLKRLKERTERRGARQSVNFSIYNTASPNPTSFSNGS